MPRPKAIDLFAGAGGMSLGFEQAGFDIVAAVEIDPIHAGVHKYNFPETPVLCEDISQLSGERLLQVAGLDDGQDLDVIFGGPPCQGFSLIGKRLIDDPRNSLVGHFSRLVIETNPKYFVMENVSGLTIGDAKTVLQQFIKEFEGTGYKVIPYRVLNAANYGVPQNRKRLFVVGYREDMIPPNYPEAITSIRGKAGIEGMEMPDLPWCPSVREAIGDLPNIDNYSELLSSDCVPFDFTPRSEYASKLNSSMADTEDLSIPRNWNHKMLTSSLRTEHTAVTIERFRNTPGGQNEPVSRFLKLHYDGICNTLRAGTDSKRGAHTSPRPIHPIDNRVISVREAARLHSFPDWFRFHVTKWHGFREIGNSVPPLLARAVGKQIVEALGLEIERPNSAIQLGDENLLSMDMTAAANFFSVDRNVIGTRERKPVLQEG